MICVPPREAYRRWAATFDSGASPILALESRVLDPLMPSVEGRRVLDLGCGTGRWLRWAVERGACGIGIDLSPEMLRAGHGIGGRIALADAMRSPCRDGCADVVISTLALGHLRPIREAMREFARIASAGGWVIVTDFHPDALRRGWKRTFASGGETIEMESEPYSLDELGNERLRLVDFREAGFGEPERPIFDAAGKSELFERVRGHSAIFVARFRRVPWRIPWRTT